MKRINKISSLLGKILVLLPIMMLTACGSKTSNEISSTSPDGKTTIFVNGNKANFGDPWHATIKTKTSTYEKEVVTEIFASELNNENVKFNWEANDKCRIVFIQQDDTERKLFVEADSSHIDLHEE